MSDARICSGSVRESDIRATADPPFRSRLFRKTTVYSNRFQKELAFLTFLHQAPLPCSSMSCVKHGKTNMKNKKTPYKCHLFVCTRSRNGEEKSCADGDSSAVKALLKDAIHERGWKGIVRVSESGCLGVCSLGPNIMIYPQSIWLTQVKPADISEILNIVEQSLAQ